MASAGSAQRNLTRKELIARVVHSLALVSADVSLQEVTSVVDGMVDASGSYDPEAVFIAGEECLRLWARRDQAGMVCLLRLSQERFVDVQEKMQEANTAQAVAQAAAQVEIEQLKEQMAELRALVASQAKEETKEEGQPENKAEIDQLKEQMAELRALVASKAKEETKEEGQPENKEAKTEKQWTEEELKDREAWGNLKDYNEAFENRDGTCTLTGTDPMQKKEKDSLCRTKTL